MHFLTSLAMIPKTPTPKNPRQVGHTAKKRFGQNFLQDAHTIAQIVDCLNLSPDDNLLEIGPGLGALTEPMLAQVDAMTVIELDHNLAERLPLHIGANSHPNFTIVCTNALTVDLHALAQKVGRGAFRVVGNLPYNISTPILFHLLDFKDSIIDMHFMLQKEVVERITADVGTKAYGRLSVVMQYHCQSEYLLTVPAHAFSPAPKVVSSVFRLTPYQKKPLVASDEHHFFVLVRECFNQRRKTLRAIFNNNHLLPSLDDSDFAAIGIDPKARPETLSVADFVALSNHSLLKGL